MSKKDRLRKEKACVVIDTNVFMIDPGAIHKFPGYEIIVPLVVIEELDKFKRETTPIGKAARETIRVLDTLRKKGKLTDGVTLENDSKLQVYLFKEDSEGLPDGLDGNLKDNYILQAALELSRKRETKLITKDANLRIKADVLGIPTEDYFEGFPALDDDLYSGYTSIPASSQAINQFYQAKSIRLESLQNDLRGQLPTENEYAFLDSGEKSALGKVKGKELHALEIPDDDVFGIQPRNREQRYVFDALLDPSISLVTIAGKAGTGKTLLAIACGLFQTLETEHYRRLLVARPIIPMGRDIGALPGELSEKLQPWMQPIYDNLELLLDAKGEGGEHVHYLTQKGVLSVEPLTYIRGRSISKQFLIVDEAQNLSPHEAKTIITRAGEGTKIVFTGDIYQIDHPYLNLYTNGLTFTMERFKGQSLAAHITLVKGERSALAELASKVME